MWVTVVGKCHLSRFFCDFWFVAVNVMYKLYFLYLYISWCFTWLPSVLWRCWLGVRKNIRPVENEWWVAGVVICLERSVNDLHHIWSSWGHCHSIISCCIKIENGSPFWCQLTQVVLEKRPLNVCLSVCCVTWQRWSGSNWNIHRCWHADEQAAWTEHGRRLRSRLQDETASSVHGPDAGNHQDNSRAKFYYYCYCCCFCFCSSSYYYYYYHHHYHHYRWR